MTNLYNTDIPIISIVVALFALITVYYGLLIIGFGRSWNKLIVSYTIIIILLIMILLISQYYLSNFTEQFIANYTTKTSRNVHINDNTDYMNKTAFTQNPFASGFNIDDMCKSTTSNKLDHDDISWKCRVRDVFNKNSVSLKTTEDDVNSSVKYPLKYDGIHSLDI